MNATDFVALLKSAFSGGRLVASEQGTAFLCITHWLCLSQKVSAETGRETLRALAFKQSAATLTTAQELFRRLFQYFGIEGNFEPSAAPANGTMPVLV
jgi:hypothetical protein